MLRAAWYNGDYQITLPKKLFRYAFGKIYNVECSTYLRVPYVPVTDARPFENQKITTRQRVTFSKSNFYGDEDLYVFM